MKTKITLNPVFFTEDALQALGDDDRRDALLHDQRSVDLLTWNVFASLARHRDQPWLADRLRVLGGDQMRAPARISLWTGRTREPLLTPNSGYLAAVRDRIRASGAEGEPLESALREFRQPAEAAVRIESPDVLCLVDTTLTTTGVGAGGRDRLVELIDAGLDQARRVGKQLAVAVVYPSGTQLGGELSARVQSLRANVRAELPHRDRVPEVALREVSWQELLTIWEAEIDWMDLWGQPVKQFLQHCTTLGLR